MDNLYHPLLRILQPPAALSIFRDTHIRVGITHHFFYNTQPIICLAISIYYVNALSYAFV